MYGSGAIRGEQSYRFPSRVIERNVCQGSREGEVSAGWHVWGSKIFFSYRVVGTTSVSDTPADGTDVSRSDVCEFNELSGITARWVREELRQAQRSWPDIFCRRCGRDYVRQAFRRSTGDSQ